MRTAAILAALALTGCLNSHSPTEPNERMVTGNPGDIVLAACITVVVREGSISRSAVTDANGFFRMDGLMPGTANVTYSSPAFGGFDGSLPVVLHQGMNDIDIPTL